MRAVGGVVLAGLVWTAVGAGAPAVADVTTASSDTLRTGWDSHETALAPSDVGSPDFGQLFATQLDGQVYAQPVLAQNTLLAVTENDKAYGLDPVTGAIRWTRDVGPAWSVAPLGCGDLVPSIGITSTPVVDPATGTAYFTAKVDDAPDADHPHWELHAVDITTGVERSGFPSTISGSPDNDPSTPFSPRTQLQRAGLLLLDGVVYAGFGSHCDVNPFSGYVVGVDATTGRRTSMWASQTGGTSGAGIWHGGGGLVSDGPGRIILTTGNGISPAKGPGSTPPANLGESVVRLQVQPDQTLQAADFFSPVNNTKLDTEDTDLGSGGPMALPDGYGTAAHPHLLVENGKDGRVFLLDRDDLGGTGQGAGGTDDVLQSGGPYRGVWGHPAFWGGSGGYVYTVPSGGPLSAFKVGVSGSGDPLLTRTGTSTGGFGFSSGSPVVTSDGTTAGSALVWVVFSQGSNGAAGQLRAYDAVPSAGTLALRYSAPIGTASKFTTPATDSGRVYVGNRSGQLLGFGRPSSIPLMGTPTDFGLVGVGTSVTKQVTVTAQKDLSVTRTSTAAPFTTGATTLPKTLAAGTSMTVPVTFKPTVAGSVAGALSFTTSAGTYAFDVHGYATKDGLRSDPASLDFGQVPVGGKVTLSVNVSNTGATTNQITSARGPSAPFSAAGLPAKGSSLSSGASVSVAVTFAPTATGDTASEAFITSSTGNVHIPVKGTGVAGAPQLSLSPMQLDLGEVEVGGSVTKSFDITNSGNLLLTLSKAAPPTAPFLVPTPVAEGQQIEPGDVIHQSVTFSPTKAGAFSGTYVFSGNDGRGLQVVQLTGSAVVPKARPLVGLGGRCVDLRYSRTADGTPVQLFTCNGSAAQQWTVSGGTVRALDRCLDTAGGAKVKGTKTVIAACNGGPSQGWTLQAGSQALVNTGSGMCLDVPGSRVVDSLQLQIYPCNATPAQQWTQPG